MLKKPYRNQNIINMLEWITPRVVRNTFIKKNQLKPVLEII